MEMTHQTHDCLYCGRPGVARGTRVALVVLACAQLATFALLADALGTRQSEAVAALPELTEREAHGSYCRVGDDLYFLGRDADSIEIRGYREFKRWCRTHDGTVGFKP